MKRTPGTTTIHPGRITAPEAAAMGMMRPSTGRGNGFAVVGRRRSE